MKLKFTITVILFFFLIGNTFAQLTNIPSFPRADQKVKIIYDATKGTSGLLGVDPVYIHIGAVISSPTATNWAIVPFTWGQADVNARMKKVSGEANIWEWELTPNEFFNISAGQVIYRLGMVFRNANGSLEGKNDVNGDFFINLSQGFDVSFTTPQSSAILLEIGESQEISIVASEVSDLSISINNAQTASAMASESLNFKFNAEDEGIFNVLAKATSGTQEATANLYINVVGQSPQANLPPGIKRGINYISDTEVVLVLEAPKKKNVFVIGDFNNWKILPNYQMFQTPNKEMFWLRISDLVPGEEYIFQYLVDGSIRIGDPYADKTSDPFNDQEIINQNRYPDLKPYPQGKTEFQATYLQTAQIPYQWKHLDYVKPKPEELVVYELLVRDFDDKRTYKSVIARLDYLKELGVNALELMPIKEFEGNLSWGYNPSFFFAPDKYYGSKNELKALIDEAHKRDMVVILDMVLNHAFGQNPMVRLYNDGDYGAPTLDNPWFNREAKHPFNVGYDFNHESTYTKAFVDSVNDYWLSEYKFDGYRFDLSKGFTQVNSGGNVSLWGQRDASRIAIWKNIYDNIKANHPDAYLILEHFADNSEERELANYGLMFWGNMNGDFREIAKGNNRNFDWAYYKTRGWEQSNLIAYMESHDEERTMWESINFGQRSPVDIRQLNHAVNRNQLMATFFFAIPGPKMLWQFEEFGYDLELNNDRLGVKPTRWNYLDNPDRMRLFNLYRAMIHFKKDFKVFNTPEEVTLSLTQTVKSIKIADSNLSVVIYGNFGISDVNNISMTFPSSGLWYNYFTGEEVNITANSVIQSLKGNQFVIYTNQKLSLPKGQILEDLITSVGEELLDEISFKLYPNPSSDKMNITIPNGFNQFNYRILDMTGKTLVEGREIGIKNNLEIEIKDFKAGIYIFELNDSRQLIKKRFIKK